MTVYRLISYTLGEGAVAHRGLHGRRAEHAAHPAVHPRPGGDREEPQRVPGGHPRREGVGQLLGLFRKVRQVVLQGAADITL